MKDFKDTWFKGYAFPIILAFLSVYFRDFLNFKPINDFFAGNSNKVVQFFNLQLHLWQIILYGILIYIIVKVYSSIFNSKTKEERKMRRAIAKDKRIFFAQFQDGKKFLAKYKLGVIEEHYEFEKFAMYCNNCDQEPQKMTSHIDGRFACIKCSSVIDYLAIRNIKTAIINNVEKNER